MKVHSRVKAEELRVWDGNASTEAFQVTLTFTIYGYQPITVRDACGWGSKYPKILKV